MQVRELLGVLDKIAPMSIKESYDNVGLIVGNEDLEITGILLALDLTMDVLDEAVNKNANVIISHHPIIFDAVKKIDTSLVNGKIITRLIEKNICSIAMHTNMDKARGGLNDYLCEVVGIKNTKVLEDDTEGCCICVYVPKGEEKKIREAMFDAGAGEIGEYQGCAFELEGIGHFEPKQRANPYKGGIGERIDTTETKVEVYCDASKATGVICAMLEVHPYQTPVYFVFETKAFESYGLGRYGELEKEMTAREYCGLLQQVLGEKIRYIGDDDTVVRTVGVCSGAGSGMFDMASKLGLDAFITGDIKHNIAIDAQASKTVLIDAGHFGSEVIFKNIMARHLQNWFDRLQCNIDILNSQVEKSPWRYV